MWNKMGGIRRVMPQWEIVDHLGIWPYSIAWCKAWCCWGVSQSLFGSGMLYGHQSLLSDGIVCCCLQNCSAWSGVRAQLVTYTLNHVYHRLLYSQRTEVFTLLCLLRIIPNHKHFAIVITVWYPLYPPLLDLAKKNISIALRTLRYHNRT
jgi:hypothetical protein